MQGHAGAQRTYESREKKKMKSHNSTTTAYGARVNELVLTSAEAEKLAELADTLVPDFVGGVSPLSQSALRAQARLLPSRLGEWLDNVRQDRDSHAAVLRGCPVRAEELGHTPLHWKDGETRDSVFHSCVLLLLAHRLGRAFGWLTQQAGRVVTDVVPSPGLEDSLVSSSSRAELNWHTEDAFSSERADFVGLSCLRAAEGGATTISFVDPGQLPESTLELLTKPRFLIVPDDAHDVAIQPPNPVPLMEVGYPCRIRVDRDFTSVTDGDVEAGLALEALIEVLDANLQDLPLEPGDIAFLDNMLSVHGRRSFTPRFDGTDRWLKRVNVKASL